MGTSERVLLIGDPVEHSLSPAMQNAAFRARGLDLAYEARRVTSAELGRVLDDLRHGPFRGANVTIPHKEAVLGLVEEYGADVETVGAANTIVRDDGRLRAENTDVHGFRMALAEHGLSVRGRRVLLLGAGGAARACAAELERGGAILKVAARRRERAEALVAAVLPGGDRVPVDWPRDLVGYDMLVNATPLGLGGEDPLPGVELGRWMVVFDLVPTAAETPLARRARAAGCRVVDGLLMLLHQAAASFRLWTGLEPPLDVMRAALPRRV